MIAMPETAMVMAAGLGTRMRPLTDQTAKPLLRVAGKSMLDILLDTLTAAGVQRVIVNVHWCADQVEAHLAKRRDLEVIISEERGQLLETGGGLAKARPLLGDEPIFVVNTDAFWFPFGSEPLIKLAETFDPEQMDECLLLADRHRSLGFHGKGDFYRAEDGTLTRRGESDSVPWAYAGIRILKPQLYDDRAIEPFSANLVWDELLPDQRLHGQPLDRFWLHVGDPQALNDAEAWLRSNGA
ncbi:MAG: nucleotidyltransferase family protein [Pseudomonadota bacterium]